MTPKKLSSKHSSLLCRDASDEEIKGFMALAVARKSEEKGQRRPAVEAARPEDDRRRQRGRPSGKARRHQPREEL